MDSGAPGRSVRTVSVVCMLSSVRSRGFTLIEMLVSIGIAGTLAAALIVSLLIGRETYLSSSASIDVQQEARRAFQTMVQELRESGANPANVAPDSQRQATRSTTTRGRPYLTIEWPS